MIPQIEEINFPEYATLSTATASLVDMGDKTITAQVKIDGSIAPDFSYDWEIEFQGERYIQPLRKPQGSKGNESISSTIDLTFYHKGIYDLKRYFFVSVVELNAGTLMADNYIVPLRLNIAEFVDYLNNVLSYYYGSTYKVFLNPDYEYDETDRKDIDINFTKIWDVITKIHEWFGVRWAWDTHSDNGEYYSIKIDPPSVDVSHIFEYGFEGGLLKFERQVQNAEIANVVFGRGSSENIPYRYFKNKSEDNPTFPADPDWIPELENIYFANLRGKTFRDYVQGWKTNPNRNTLDGTIAIESYDTKRGEIDFAYKRGHEDTAFNPIEYVKDDESIAKYGEIQKGLEHNEEIKPTIQGVTIDGMGRVDQIVDVESILVDESTENTEVESKVVDIDEDKRYNEPSSITTKTYSIKSSTYQVPYGYKGSFIKDYKVSAIENVQATLYKYSGDSGNPIIEDLSDKDWQLTTEVQSFKLIDADTKVEITNVVNIDGGTNIYIEYVVKVTNFVKAYDDTVDDPFAGTIGNAMTIGSNCDVILSLSWQLDYTPVHGQILGNYEDGATRKSQTTTIPANGTSQVVFTTEQFTITEENAPATSVEMPYRITSSLKGGEYDPRPNVVAIDVNTGETVSPINLPAGTYRLQNSIQIFNLASKQQTFKVELLPTYIYYSYDSTSWKPTFDIWVKNIWNTEKKWIEPSIVTGDKARWETDYEYEHRIWDAILGNHLGNEAKVVFSSGRLSGHSDWEFLIADTPKRDTSKTIDGVPSEWRITLYKSDAEMEATDKWLPSIMTQASAGDHFYFVGIEMPHQYVLWAEESLDKYKREELDKVSDVDSTIVVQLDKVRLNQLQEGESKLLLNSVRVGNNIKVADSRFIQSPHETLRLQSVTYTWDANTIMLSNIEVVLSDEIATYSNPFEDINRKIDDAEGKIKDVRKTSLAQIDKAKKSIRNTSSKINTLSSNNANIVNQVNILIGNDKWMSAREIAEEVTNPIDERVSTLIGGDVNKSVRTIATEVLAGASTGGDIDLDLYLSKSEAEATYATKESLKTTNNSIDSIATQLGKAETNIGNNSNLLSSHSQQLLTLQTEQNTQKATIQQQGATILALDLEVDGVKGDVSETKGEINAINTKINNKVSKDDLKPLKYTVNGVSQIFNGLSETTIPQIFTPTQAGSQGQVLQSMGGGAPQWANLSDIKGTISFAKDLTGVIEATPEEFTFRPSAGDKSIRDESAVIRRIKGNTIVWGQLADITQVSNTGARYIMETGDGWFSIQRDLSNTGTPYCYVNMVKQYAIPTHKYLFSQEIEVSGIVTSDDYCSAAAYNFTPYSIVNYTQNGKYSYTKILTKLDDTTFQFFYYAYGNAKLKVSNLQCFDLTSLFGDGNEPTTIEEFKAIYPDIYPYCEPEIRNMRTTAIETVGFNLYNGDYAKLIGGKTYYIGGTDIGTLTFTPNGTTASEVVELGDDRTYTPLVSGKIYSTGTDVCVHFQHSGIKDGECADYVEHILELPEITKYFPDGMNGIGKVYDEINADNAIQRCGVRAYEDGDENDPNVITDRTNTVYQLAEPIVTPIIEPIQLAYDVEDFGTERAISPEDSAPFRADIVYQFNAEGRIRDNGRNIDKLETQVNTLNSVTGAIASRFDGEMVVASGIVDSDENSYLLPSSNNTDKSYRLATEQYVEDMINDMITTTINTPV